MGTNTVGGIDIVVRKKPGGQTITIQIEDTGRGNKVTSVVGANAAEYQKMSAIGLLVGGLISGEIQNATISSGAQFQVTVTKSISNIKSN